MVRNGSLMVIRGSLMVMNGRLMAINGDIAPGYVKIPIENCNRNNEFSLEQW